MFRSSNPVFTKMNNDNGAILQSAPMTVNGTIGKAFLLILIALVAGAAVLYEAIQGYTDKVMTIMTIALFGGLVTGLVAVFVKKLTKYFAPIYAFCEGALLTGVSLMLEAQFPGIAVQAVVGTMFAFLVMLILYRVGLIKATEKFRSVLMTAMVAILLIYLVNLVGMFFNFSIPFVNGSGHMGILFSGIVVAIAALNLILDFDFIEQGQANMLPKDFEWYGAFGLMVTLVWLYIEILRLLAKLRGRD